MSDQTTITKNAKHSILARLASTVLLFLFFWASQATYFLHLPSRLFSQQTLTQYQWIGMYESHIWELLFALAFIGIVSKGRWSDYGLNLKNWKLSLRILWKFGIVFTLIVIAWNVIPAVMRGSVDLGTLGPATPFNVAAWMFFEWIFVGFSEEVMFRGLLNTRLLRVWPGKWCIAGFTLSHATLATTILFCLAHIDPIHLTFYWPQLLFAFGLGIYYSTVREKTGSLLNSTLAHGISDGLSVTAIYILHAVLHGAH